MLHDCKLVLLDPLQSPIRVYYDLGSRGKALFGFLRVNLQIGHQGIESPFHSGSHCSLSLDFADRIGKSHVDVASGGRAGDYQLIGLRRIKFHIAVADLQGNDLRAEA